MASPRSAAKQPPGAPTAVDASSRRREPLHHSRTCLLRRRPASPRPDLARVSCPATSSSSNQEEQRHGRRRLRHQIGQLRRLLNRIQASGAHLLPLSRPTKR